MENLVDVLSFYKNKKVLVTGHTGFKGSWLCQILLMAGADVIGYSLEPPTNPSLFNILGIKNSIRSYIGDICDYDALLEIFKKEKPEIVFHLAAQPIVRDSYKKPRETYLTNVLGVVNICEIIRITDCVQSFLNVTTDKVYENNDEKNHHFVEDEKLDGFDPYSNSKSCSELVTHSYYRSFLNAKKVATSTARAGNVIGGGDFANDRIVPDCFRSIENSQTLYIRNPKSIRPYQHVLEPLFCYLIIAKEQFLDANKCGSYNIGPDYNEIISTEEIVSKFFKFFSDGCYLIKNDNGPHESSYLSLNNEKMKTTFGWFPRMGIDKAVEMTAEWYSAYLTGDVNLIEFTNNQIKRYIGATKYDKI